MKLLGLEAWIECDGKRLDEYNIEVEGNQIACWVVSEVEKVNNCLLYLMYIIQDALNGAVELLHCDYQRFRNRLPNPLQNGRVGRKKKVMTCSEDLKISRFSGVHLGCADEMRPLRFSTLNTTEPQDTTNYYPDSDDVGSIEIQLWCIKNVKLSGKLWSPIRCHELFNLRSVPEASKVMSSHCVRLGDPIKTRVHKGYPKTYDVVDNPKRDPPHMSFRFKYRSRDILQALGIIPRPPVLQQAQSSSASNSSLGKRRYESSPGDDTTESRKRAPQPSPDAPALAHSIIHSQGQASEELKPIVHIKDESGDESDDMDALEAQFELIHKTMKSMKKQIDRLNAKRGEQSSARAVKREAATINLGSWNGETIDLPSR
ncbi:hypothetical protein WOLCODRAFT_139882 [Wolfiporia cocos MD-104 SS10]|uniref:DUF7918 domain-containing protein n=1 Tax=Wolfiporia cocos (strain MD-104) TaxID=742152 RepID=A0A2H3IZH4_WOLCO|nr:hypothetical protein WOLCODRAFT_139882 [Wolfiporia cocos MD-104 SS10]